MRIGSRVIAPGEPVYVIAELGVNHDGSPARLLELVRAAHGAGADAVKLQVFRAALLLGREAGLAAYQREAGEADPGAMLHRLELPIDAMAPAVSLAHELGMHAIATVFSLELVAEAHRLAWDAYKTASPDIVHRPLLEALAGTGRPLIVSTGASTEHEVRRAAGWLACARGRCAMLQCVSSYPCAPEDAALEGIAAVRAAAGMPTGYSDHTERVETGASAVAHGALLLEKHLTLDRGAAGPDHRASLDPAGFARYVRLARRAGAGTAGGHGAGKVVRDCERDVRAVSRQSITAARRLEAGRVVARSDVTFARPGVGLEPWQLDEVVGRRLARPVEAGMAVRAEDLG